MISDAQLMRVSLIISVIGIIALFLIVQFIEPAKVRVSEIDDSMNGQIIATEGMIKEMTKMGGNFFITLYDEKDIAVVMFKIQAEKNDFVYQMKNGDWIRVEGKVAIYRGDLEIIAENIKKL